VKKIALAALLLFSALAWAGTIPNPADYTINVHVTASNSYIAHPVLILNVVIGGKNYVLRGYLGGSLLALGDYKAKLVRDEHKVAYESIQEYEFLFPDMKTAKFGVVGQTE